MTKVIKTKFATPNPFAPLRKATPKTDIKVSSLAIEATPYNPVGRRSTASKYDSVFAKLKVGECVVCAPEAVASINSALRKYHQKLGAYAIVRSITKCNDGKGRVWLMRVDSLQQRKAA